MTTENENFEATDSHDSVFDSDKKKTITIAVAKQIAKLVVTHSVSATVAAVIHQNTESLTKKQRVELAVGAYVIGSMIADKAWDHTEQRIEEVVDTIKEVRNRVSSDGDVYEITDI